MWTTSTKGAASPDDLAAIDDATVLDCSGQLCPMPIYRASRAMATLGTGEILEVIATDRGSVRDFPAFARQAGHTLLETREGGGAWTFRIRKGGTR